MCTFYFFFDKSVIGEGCCDWKTWIYELYLNLIFLSAFKILKLVWEMLIQGRFVSFGDICLPGKGERWSRKQFLCTEIVQVKVLWVVVKEKLRGKVFVEYSDGKPLHDLFYAFFVVNASKNPFEMRFSRKILPIFWKLVQNLTSEVLGVIFHKKNRLGKPNLV